MKVAITVRRISPLHGMSVRDTAQAIGTAKTMHKAVAALPISRELTSA